MKRADFERLTESGVAVFGDLDWRGSCPTEAVEQATFVGAVRRGWPDTFGRLLVHIENEGKLVKGQFSRVSMRRALGMTKGAADIVIPGAPAFVCEMKRRDYRKSKWQEGQIEYLIAAADAGAFACVALGHRAALEAFSAWSR